MALTKDANIGIQSDVDKQRKAALKKLDSLRKAEEKRIQAAGQNFSPADIQKYNAAKAKALLDNDAAFGAAKPKLAGKIQTNFGAEELHSYSVAGTAKGSKLDFQIKSEQDLFSSIMGRSRKIGTTRMKMAVGKRSKPGRMHSTKGSSRRSLAKRLRMP
jgi:hypothetical protein